MKRKSMRAEAAHKRLLDDHQEIARLSAAIAATSDAKKMARPLAELEPLLVRHFGEEEAKDGVFGAIRSVAPECEKVLTHLAKEHADLLAAVRALQAATQKVPAPKGLKQLGIDLQEQLRRHEAHENEVYLDSIWNEIGEGD